ncbi:hypothetical protein BU24DRAFT_10711 [Aaosphaeria arxii CBS 175.79]|uniref:Uncharacterized protein n=1 Tax=Aaosphaeria arxii CBS 175.79 TaxID=1450172 RepID=A0A6A5Y7A1_9PLEO|nr:uncharacterized protein BU24DRAFT_10711 [Aaosphaeria arxii CBS 175.79]KAF2020907.1 hypothetical protein BU24DRAFT_10711 [Aaosphaeria arxii CBS 175.79]
MTRRTVYGIGLVFAIACTIMTIASIAIPRWVSYSPNDKRQFSIGLHSRCSTVTGTCTSYPKPRDCKGNFCHMWRTVGFLISFAVVVELATLVSFVVIIAGGVQRRTAGWKIASTLLVLGGIIQCAGMAIVAYLFDNDERFFEGWYLDLSWTLCTASWSLLVLTSLGMAASALYLPAEGDYEVIPEYPEIQQDNEQLQTRIAGWNDGYGSGRSYQNAQE